MTPGRIMQMRHELYCRGEWTPEAGRYVRRLGIDLRYVEAHAGIFAVCLCKFFGGNTGEAIFEFSPEGVPAAVIEAFKADGASVVDLIAWPLDDPEQIATAGREADMLGIWSMLQRGGRPLRVHRTPEGWLQAKCDGCCVINPDWGGYWLDKAGGPFIAEDVQHGHELRHVLGRNAARHRLLVPDEARAA